MPFGTEGLKLRGTHQLLVYTDVYLLGDNMNTVEKTQVLLRANREVGLEVNAEGAQYIYKHTHTYMSHQQNTGKNHNVKVAINPWKMWQSVDIWECMKKLGADSIQSMFTTVQPKIFSLPICYLKAQR